MPTIVLDPVLRGQGFQAFDEPYEGPYPPELLLNWGTADERYLLGGLWPIPLAQRIYLGLVKYDISAIGVGTILKAELLRSWSPVWLSVAWAEWIRRATEDWTPGEGTTPTLGPIEDSGYWGTLSSTPAGPYVMDVTALVQEWQAETQPNYGLAFYGYHLPIDGTPLVAQPRLQITYLGEGGGPGGDEEDPVVQITEPLEGAMVAGDVRVAAAITDNVGVDVAILYVDGQAQGTLDAPNYGGQWGWVWDSCPWANGSHTIEVRAWDAAGNMGSDSVAVTLNNSLATARKIWYSLPCPGEFESWETARKPVLGLLTLDADPAPLNPAKVLNCKAYVGPGNVVDPDEIPAGYIPVEVNRVHGIPDTWPSMRWALCGEPAQALAYWEVEAEEIVAMCLFGGSEDPPGWVALLTGTPARLLSFDGVEVTELADLSAYEGDPHDVVYAGGKLLVALGAKLLAYDLDVGDILLEIGLPGVTEIRALAPRGTEEAWIGGDVEGGGRLLSFSYPEPRVIGDIEQILALGSYGSNLVAIGCAGGKVYLSAGSAPALAYATSEADVLDLYELSGNLLVGTGTAGKVFRSSPAWGEEADFSTLNLVKALGEYQGKAYGGGDSAELWRRDAAATWAQALVLEAVTAINCLLEFTDVNGAVSLLIGTTGAAARLYRLEMASGGRFQCGVELPNIGIAVLKTMAGE